MTPRVMPKGLFTTLRELARLGINVLVMGAGMAGVHLAKAVYDYHPEAKVAVLEWGPFVTDKHVLNMLDYSERARFIEKYAAKTCEGDLSSAIALPMLGGMSVVGATHLVRWYSDCFRLWPWPGAHQPDTPPITSQALEAW